MQRERKSRNYDSQPKVNNLRYAKTEKKKEDKNSYALKKSHEAFYALFPHSLFKKKDRKNNKSLKSRAACLPLPKNCFLFSEAKEEEEKEEGIRLNLTFQSSDMLGFHIRSFACCERDAPRG